MVIKLGYGSGLGEGLSSLGASIGQALKARTAKTQLQEIMKPYQRPTDTAPAQQQQPQEGGVEQTDTMLGGVLSGVQNETVPVAEQIFSQKNAEIQHKKQQAAALEAEGYHPQAQMMMQEAQHQETFLQQERLQDKKLNEKVSSEKDKRAFEENKPYYERINRVRTELPQKEATLLGIRDALINSGGNIDRLRNYISTFFSPEQQDYINTSSAQQLSSFVKDFFVGELREIPGMRLNQMIESNLKSALQSPGKTEESNQVITEFQQFKNDILKKEIEISDRIKNQYLKAGREPPRNFQEQVANQLKPYTQEKQKELIQTYQDIKQGKFKSAQMLNMPLAKEDIKDNPAKPGFTYVISPKGSPVQVPNNEVPNALKSGGVLVK